MEEPKNLAECMKIAIKLGEPINLIAEIYGIDAPKHEMEGLLSEALATSKGKKLLRVVLTAPSPTSVRRAFNRLRGEIESREDLEPVLGALLVASRLLERLREFGVTDSTFYSEEYRTHIKKKVVQMR